MTDHKKVSIPMKVIEVDELMVPIIQWLNASPNILTFSCCQGDATGERVRDQPDLGNLWKDVKKVLKEVSEMSDGREHITPLIENLKVLADELPLVIFHCTEQETLRKVAYATQYVANITIDIYSGSLRYYIRFHSREALETFTERLKRENLDLR